METDPEAVATALVAGAQGVRQPARALSGGGGWLGPLEAEDLLTAFGIPVAAMRVARDEATAAAAAKTLGFPVAVKAVGPTILHKTEVGGVRLNLTDEAAVSL